jgi:hypothetical protein
MSALSSRVESATQLAAQQGKIQIKIPICNATTQDKGRRRGNLKKAVESFIEWLNSRAAVSIAERIEIVAGFIIVSWKILTLRFLWFNLIADFIVDYRRYFRAKKSTIIGGNRR